MSWWNFWKHDRISDESELSKSLNLPSLDEHNLGYPDQKNEPLSFELSKNPEAAEMRGLYDSQKSMRPQMVPQNSISSPDMQILSAKLDTIKAMLDLINQRLTLLEKNADENKTKKMW